MNPKPVLTQVDDCEWETWPEEAIPTQGVVFWKTLLSQDKTPSADLTMGLGEIPPDEILHAHRHAPAEAYFILEGTGLLGIDGQENVVEAGTAVFIPGYAIHSLKNIGAAPLRFLYIFPVDSFQEVEYIFDVEV